MHGFDIVGSAVSPAALLLGDTERDTRSALLLSDGRIFNTTYGFCNQIPAHCSAIYTVARSLNVLRVLAAGLITSSHIHDASFALQKVALTNNSGELMFTCDQGKVIIVVSPAVNGDSSEHPSAFDTKLPDCITNALAKLKKMGVTVMANADQKMATLEFRGQRAKLIWSDSAE